jgi:predicted transport protein
MGVKPEKLTSHSNVVRNFVCFQIYPKSNSIVVYVKVNPDTINIEEGTRRDVRKIGHYATGDSEITI